MKSAVLGHTRTQSKIARCAAVYCVYIINIFKPHSDRRDLFSLFFGLSESSLSF